MQAVSQLTEMSAPLEPQGSSTASAPTTPLMLPDAAKDAQSISSSKLIEPEPEPSSDKKTQKPLTAEEEWVLVAGCAAFLSTACLGDSVKTRPVKTSAAEDDWLLVDTGSTARASTGMI